MGRSPLLGGERTPRKPAGTSTDDLGPSDTSDSGSDIHGATGAVDTYDSGLNADDTRREAGVGADLGDADLDSDTDHTGTGERAEAGRDTLEREAPDIGPDRVEGPAGGSPDVVDDLAGDTQANAGAGEAENEEG